MTHGQRILDYRLSRARRVVDNAFGILSSRFRVLHTTTQVRPHNATTITNACLVRHNSMRDRYPRLQNEQLDEERDGIIVPGSWCAAGVLMDSEREATIGARSTREGRELRQYLMHYVNSPGGNVPWQDSAIEAPLN